MTKQITTEELAKVNALNERYNKIYFELGQNTAQIKDYLKALEVLNTEADNLHKDYQHAKAEEEVLVATLNEKYGAGQLDLITGVITL